MKSLSPNAEEFYPNTWYNNENSYPQQAPSVTIPAYNYAYQPPPPIKWVSLFFEIV